MSNYIGALVVIFLGVCIGLMVDEKSNLCPYTIEQMEDIVLLAHDRGAENIILEKIN